MGKDKAVAGGAKAGDKKDEKKDDKKGGKDDKKGGKDDKKVEEKKEKKEGEEEEVVVVKKKKKEKVGIAKKALITKVVPSKPILKKALKKKDKSKSAPMRQIAISKLIVQICTGAPGDPLTKAARVLNELTEQEPVYGRARLTVRTFGIRRNEKISAYVTVRGQKAMDILRKGLQVHEFELKDGCFSQTGNFGFGIQEHIDLGLKYDPSIGIYGMDFFIVLGRPGFRVSSRKRCRSRIGVQHLITKEDAKKWFMASFNGNVRAE